MNKILSVVVPAYNAENYIRRNLDSMCIEKEDMEKLEILVVDDGGTDATKDITREYERNYPGIISFHHKENGGHGSVINYGIRHATGKYFKVVDGDDWLNKMELKSFLKLLEERDEDIIASDYQCIQDETWLPLRLMKATEDNNKYTKSGLISEGFVDKVIKMHSLTIKTAILKEMNREIDEHCFYVDAEYITYPIPFADSVYYDRRNVYMYRLGRDGQSMDIKSMQRNRKQHMQVMKSLEQFYSELPELPEKKKHYIERCIAQIVENQFQIDISRGNEPGVTDELRAWDQELKKNYPGIYNSTERKSITLLRMTNYRILPIGKWIYDRVKGQK